MPMNPSIVLSGQNVPKTFMFRVMSLKWGQHWLLLILITETGILNMFTNAGLQAGYFTKIFCQKKKESQIQRMDKKANKQNSNKNDLELLEKNC